MSKKEDFTWIQLCPDFNIADPSAILANLSQLKNRLDAIEKQYHTSKADYLQSRGEYLLEKNKITTNSDTIRGILNDLQRIDGKAIANAKLIAEIKTAGGRVDPNLSIQGYRRISALEGKINSIETRLSNAQSAASMADARASTNETQLVNIRNEVVGYNNEVAKQNRAIAEQKADYQRRFDLLTPSINSIMEKHAQGYGKQKYTWVKFADDAYGKNMSHSRLNKAYIGFAFNKDIEQASDNSFEYTWVRL